MLQRLAGGAIVSPKLLILVQVQNAFENRDQHTEPGNNQLVIWQRNTRQKRNDRRGKNLNHLHAFEDPLRSTLLSRGVPINLIFKPGVDGVVPGKRVRSFRHGKTSWLRNQSNWR